MENTEARERVLQTAERLFTAKGYAAVTLRDIANEVGIKHASLYYHVPDGKEALFVEVTERSLARHQDGLSSAIKAHVDLRSQLQAAAYWLLAQPALNFTRMMQTDMPALSDESAHRLRIAARAALIEPLQNVLRSGLPAHHAVNVGILAGAFLSMMEGIHSLPDHYSDRSKPEMANVLIEMFVTGLR
ncbi:MAG: TetR/AcrR family transcriptional regulator [Anaerolineae bacterium]|nr:TetR/AcrR family transcriptional regulator [Anaerolineae bacterium]